MERVTGASEESQALCFSPPEQISRIPRRPLWQSSRHTKWWRALEDGPSVVHAALVSQAAGTQPADGMMEAAEGTSVVQEAEGD
jgi:hypothetical protein